MFEKIWTGIVKGAKWLVKLIGSKKVVYVLVGFAIETAKKVNPEFASLLPDTDTIVALIMSLIGTHTITDVVSMIKGLQSPRS